jgi:L-lactate dehydrogenase complex protein LldG
MTTTRHPLFARVRDALAGIAQKRPLPEYPASAAVSRAASGQGDVRARFSERLRAAGGQSFDDPSALGAWLLEKGATRGYADPAFAAWLKPALGAGIALDTSFERARIDDYQFGITRAAGAIAETGTLILTDASTPHRLAALSPWVHIALLDPADIHEHVGDAILSLGDDPNVIWVTGPSKTADVEGILIEGVHGPGEQLALFTSTARAE